MLRGRPGSEAFLGYAYAKAGRRTEAEQLAAKNSNWPNIQIPIFAGLGDNDRAFQGLERMVDNKDVRVDFYPHYPELAALRGDPRMKEFRRKRGLPWPP